MTDLDLIDRAEVLAKIALQIRNANVRSWSEQRDAIVGYLKDLAEQIKAMP